MTSIDKRGRTLFLGIRLPRSVICFSFSFLLFLFFLIIAEPINPLSQKRESNGNQIIFANNGNSYTLSAMVLQIIRADILVFAGLGKMRAMSKMSASIICNTIE